MPIPPDNIAAHHAIFFLIRPLTTMRHDACHYYAIIMPPREPPLRFISLLSRITLVWRTVAWSSLLITPFYSSAPELFFDFITPSPSVTDDFAILSARHDADTGDAGLIIRYYYYLPSLLYADVCLSRAIYYAERATFVIYDATCADIHDATTRRDNDDATRWYHSDAQPRFDYWLSNYGILTISRFIFT